MNYIERITKYVYARWPFRHTLGCVDSNLSKMVSDCNAERWHLYAITSRISRRHVCIPCAWVADNFSSNSFIFEPGCGSGANLLWLAEHGFTRLAGADIKDSAIELARRLAQKAELPVRLWRDNSLSPSFLPKNVDVLLSLNWLYHIPGSSFSDFLRLYAPCLSSRGVVVCDMVDEKYNTMSGNEYHTQDKRKPVEDRRSSEYTIRMSRSGMEAVAAKHDLRLVKYTSFASFPPRAAYLFQRA